MCIRDSHNFGRGLDRLRSVKALVLLRAGKSQAALEATVAQQRAPDDDPLAEARYIALNLSLIHI